MTERIDVLKTYKLYIGGQFPRTESGRYYAIKDAKGKLLANMCQSSRKDFRDAVVAARGALSSWSGKSAFNRSQILYRMAEMLENRKNQLVDELLLQGCKTLDAVTEVSTAIDRLVYYAGWCDKYQQVFSAVNPVASPHFNFSVPEPTGVVAIIAPQQSALIGLVSVIAPVIAGGNACVVLASESLPLAAISLAEIIHSSDVPAGVVNILTGKPNELLKYFAEHMDVNAIVCNQLSNAEVQLVKEKASLNVKRVIEYNIKNWLDDTAGQSPYFILDAQEIKTTWHPIETVAAGKSGY
ncbi:MAG: aldehyde dehydrogenase family protein [Sphingobacteriales bacterium]|nr:MAG: aldehyde dehydrogenase family protein [Sphingobacteriales bacterium]